MNCGFCCDKKNNFELNENFTLKSYLKEKISKNNLLLLLSGSVYIQISYYPFKYWKEYLKYISYDDSPRKRTLSINTENDIGKEEIITLPTTRDIKNIPENDIFNISGELEEGIFTPFSSIAKNYIDRLIFNRDIEKKPKILKIKRVEYKYSCYLIVIKENISKNIYFIPKIEIYSSMIDIKDYMDEIINNYIENENFLNYIISNRLENWNINIIGHLLTTFISYNFTTYLKEKNYNPKLIIFEPYLDDIQNIFMCINKKEKINNKINYLIFSTNINITTSPILLKNIIYIPRIEMINYSINNNKICGSDICNSNIFNINKPYNKKKNIRSYVHTLFNNIDEELYLPTIEI